MTYSNLGESNSGVIHVIALHGSNQYLLYVLYSMHPKKTKKNLKHTQFITLKESSILNSEQTQFETILIHVHGYIKFFLQFIISYR